MKILSPFYATDLFWYPLKTSENQRFSDVFRGYQKRSVAWNGLIVSLNLYECEANYLYILQILNKTSCIELSLSFRIREYFWSMITFYTFRKTWEDHVLLKKKLEKKYQNESKSKQSEIANYQWNKYTYTENQWNFIIFWTNIVTWKF